MQLSKNQLVDNRYLLVECMGSGATAEVWQAIDTKVGSLRVAIKIYSGSSNPMDTTGLADFKKELEVVYQLSHTNLLKPSAFDDWNGLPYLVMQYCENGSVSSMTGKMRGDDILKFLHDVAYGLEYIHDRNIVHQDIKPDNILVDDQLDYLITDFGISTDLNDDTKGPQGGTRAYMAPERFEGVLSSETDIWSLGATVFEMITGKVPFGEEGGLGQIAGSGIVQVPKFVDSNVASLIERMLSQDPKKRPTAHQIRKKIETYQQTGNWDQNQRRNKMIYGYTAIAAILVCLAIFLWDNQQRSHVYFYKDYVEVYGVPVGIGKVSKFEQPHRAMTYKFEFTDGKLDHLVLVNGEGNPTTDHESEHKDKYTEAYFKYNKNDKNKWEVTEIKSYDQFGKCLYVVKLSNNGRTMEFKQDDDNSTEKFLSHRAANTHSHSDNNGDISKIVKYVNEYNNQGLLVKREYYGLQGISVTDEDNIHGITYEYDSRNRLVRTTFIGLDGKPRGNKFGLSVRKMDYDSDDNWIRISYLTTKGTDSHDGTNVPVYEIAYDKYGNKTDEIYKKTDGTPSLRTDMGVSRIHYDYDEYGHIIRQSFYDVNGNPAYSKSGYSAYTAKYDENGYMTEIQYLDTEGNNAYNPEENASKIVYVNNQRGSHAEFSLFDENGYAAESNEGDSRFVFQRDTVGNVLKKSFFNKKGLVDDSPKAITSIEFVYDQFNQDIEHRYYHEGSLVNNDNGYAIVRYVYNTNGSLSSVSYFDSNNKNAYKYGWLHCQEFKYNDLGNMVSELYKKTDDSVYAKINYEYNSNNRKTTEVVVYPYNHKLDSKTKYQYDNQGNVVNECKYDYNDKIVMERRMEYNDINKMVKEFLKGKYDSRHQTDYGRDSWHVIKYKYDDRGNETEISYWNENDTPAAEDGLHSFIREYDASNNIIHQLYRDVDGNPKASKTVNFEEKYQYDNKHNQVLKTNCDGKGNPINGKDGWAYCEKTYNAKCNVIKTVYKNTEHQLVTSTDPDEKFAQSEIIYQADGKTKAKEVRTCYDGKGNLKNNSDGYNTHITLYDDNGVIESEEVKRDNGQTILLEYKDGVQSKVTYRDKNGNVTSTKNL